MSPARPDLPRDGTAQVAGRFLGRLAVFTVFAALTGHGLDRMMVDALALMAIYCVITASFRRETALAPVLTHWDEAAAYGLLHVLLIRAV